MLSSILMAFSLYSRIPVPQTQWNEKSMRYCICFLPLVGVVIGAAQALLYAALVFSGFGPVFRGAMLAVLPFLLSGGIHMDGFLDTCDAIHSYKGKEERLRILKDPHAGAFAVICGIVYFVLWFGFWSEAGTVPGAGGMIGAGSIVGTEMLSEAGGLAGAEGTSAAIAAAPGTAFPYVFAEILVLCLCFVLSRALSAFTALTFPKAKKDGMLRQETDPAAGHAAAAMGAVSVLTGILMLLISPLHGVCAAAAAAAVLLYYKRMSQKLFGGITGDLSGWFTRAGELVMVGSAIIIPRLLWALL